MKNIYFLALSPTGIGLSGGDRIFIELSRRWSRENKLTIFTTSEGIDMCSRQKLSGKKLVIKNVGPKKLPKNFLINYIYKIYLGIKFGLLSHLDRLENSQEKIYVYSASDFWMDVFPAFILKLRYRNIIWLASWYQTAPNPMKGFSEKDRRENKYYLSALMYWFSQFFAKPLVTWKANKVIVNNEDESRRFDKFQKKGKVVVLIGAVPLAEINKWRKKHKNTEKIYEAVFQGRFHAQKGVVELIDIWRKVVDKKPRAKLGMIGDGPLRKKVEQKIENLGLKNNVKLFGYVFDGDKKYRIFSSSRMALHPAFYDSGGMASAEAMAFGIPCVGFNLKAYESYYPKGMVKVKVGDIDEYAEVIRNLLDDKKYYDKIAKESVGMIERNWSWDKRADEIYKKVIK